MKKYKINQMNAYEVIYIISKINCLEKRKIPANTVITKDFMKESEIDPLPV